MTGKGLREQFGRSSRARAKDSRIEVDRKGGEERPCSPSLSDSTVPRRRGRVRLHVLRGLP
jgi:hypothetical protein